MRTEVFERPLPLPPPLLLSPSVRRSPEVRGAGTPPVAPRPPFGRDTPPPCCNPFLSRGEIPLCHLPPPSERHIGRRQLGPPKTSSFIEEKRRRKEGQKGELSANDHPFPKTFFSKEREKRGRGAKRVCSSLVAS